MKVEVVLAMLLVGAAPAAAKPLPAAMKVTLKNGKPYLTTEGVTVQLVDTWDAWTEVKVELADDGSALLVRHARCTMELEDFDPMSLPIAVVDAKIANAKGMALHVKKKYADSAKLFEQATSHDPATPVYATNWLSALVMGGEVARANKLLEDGLGKTNVAWFSWRLAVDPELKKLKAQPGAKQFRADKPGKLARKKVGQEAIAVSPLGTVAVVTGDNGGNFISFVQLDTGKETLRLPVRQAKAIDTVFAAMGFELAKTKLAWLDVPDKLAQKLQQVGDLKAAGEVGEHIVYIERTAGCDVSEFDFHAAAQKR